MHKAIFLDRDNTIIKDDGYFHRSDAIVFMPGAMQGLHTLYHAGFLLFIITNQSGIGRGYFPESDTIAVHTKIIALLHEKDIHIEKIYYCPHAPEDDCPCRKPKPFFILKAIKEFNINLAESFFVGDHEADMEAGRSAGIKTVFLGNLKEKPPFVDIAAFNLTDAAKKIITLSAHE